MNRLKRIVVMVAAFFTALCTLVDAAFAQGRKIAAAYIGDERAFSTSLVGAALGVVILAIVVLDVAIPVVTSAILDDSGIQYRIEGSEDKPKVYFKTETGWEKGIEIFKKS